MAFIEYFFTTSFPMVNNAHTPTASESAESPLDDNIKPLDLSHGQW